VRRIYHLTVDDQLSCGQIADLLNAEGVPPWTVSASSGRRSVARARLWRFSRIRAILVNPCYKGEHHYGPHVRLVPALVDVDTWQQAQAVLHSHLILSSRNAKRVYLLRGLVVCGVCGRNYCGCSPPGRAHAYRCQNSVHHLGCPAPQVSGRWLEAQVWAQVEDWLEHMDETVAALALRQQATGDSAALLLVEARRLEEEAEGHQADRDAVLDLYRRKRITETDLDSAFSRIASEQATLRERAAELRARAARAATAEQHVETTAHLLARCREYVQSGLSERVRGEVIRLLVRRVVLLPCERGQRPGLDVQGVWC
jgi:site-specific DNA recombinase